ncbi:glycosyltransferase [Roseomonas sp. GC11]|uniref:glycosyltransferase n=1 Tax=Roseomonas sp. GC11 TaxID=2950546 RepID=UPI00210BBDD5|nr:glycosyltransferase [Roseomonas sp. GC11]MCQ4159697.1 glycosyltransferase [Roseomonas sp. GC11]
MTEPRSICVIAHSHPDFSKGGGEVSAYRQVLTHRSAGQRAIYVGASEVNTSYAAQRPLDLVTPYGEDEYLFSFGGMEPERLWWDDPFQRRNLVRFLAGLPVQVYHFHHYWRIGADMIAELMEARPDATFVMTLHEMLAICLHHGQMIRTRGRELCRAEAPLRCLGCFPDKAIDAMVLRKAVLLDTLRRFDHILYPSAFIRERYEAWGLAGPRASVLENYLGDELAAIPRRAAPALAPAMARRFGFFGQPTPFKGLDILVKGLSLAITEDKDITLTIFGAEREDVLRFFPELKPVLDEAAHSIAFAGRYDPADVLSLMGAVGWVVIPSIWWENSPVVIQEARRIGTPLIASDIGGMAEKVRHGVDGLHFKRASPVDLARVLLEAAQPETHARLAASLRDVITKEEFLAALAEAHAPRQEASTPIAAQ